LKCCLPGALPPPSGCRGSPIAEGSAGSHLPTEPFRFNRLLPGPETAVSLTHYQTGGGETAAYTFSQAFISSFADSGNGHDSEFPEEETVFAFAASDLTVKVAPG